MAVRLRLKRMGNRNRPHYRITAVEGTKHRDGDVLEILGAYHPTHKHEEQQEQLYVERAAYWISVGAQPTRTVADILKHHDLTPVPGTPVEKQPTASAKGQ